MSVAAHQQCIVPSCGATYDIGQMLSRCPECGDLLDVVYDWNRINLPTDLRFYDSRRGNIGFIFDRSGVWRFRELLPFVNIENDQTFSRQIVSLDGAEGLTTPYHTSFVGKYVMGKVRAENGQYQMLPDSDLSHDERAFANDNFYMQFEGVNPTGSFKDNGMTAAFTHANMLGVKRAAVASTGNTSASVAAYARNSGILEAIIFIGDGKIAFGKLSQGLEHGAKTIQIDGDFDDAMKMVQEVSERTGIYIMNSLNPFRLEGQKTIMYRILEGLNWQMPDWVIVPGGNLGNSSAFGKAFQELYDLGLVKRIPRIAIVNSTGADTLERLVNEENVRWNNGNVPLDTITAFYATMDREKRRAHTIASAIEINRPINLHKALRTLEQTNGVVCKVTDQDILDAKAVIGLNGLFGCEPASAASVAGAKLLYQNGTITPDDIVVCVSTGHQLKDPGTTVGYHTFGQDLDSTKRLEQYGITTPHYSNRPVRVKNDIDEILAILEKM